MSEEEYERLVALCPKYFERLPYGIEFSGSGWIPLIVYIVECAKAEERKALYYKDLLTSSLIDRERITSESINLAIQYSSFSFYFTQIKEKFGALRVYNDGGSSRTVEAITAVEFISTTMCRKCGVIGIIKHRQTGLCEDCSKQ